MESILVLAQSGGEAARSGWDTVQTALLPALIVTMISLFLYMFKGLRSDVQKLSERIEARFAEARRLQDDSNLRISAVNGRLARIEGFFEILLAGRFKSVGANAAAGDAPPTERSKAGAAGEAGAVESSAEETASAEEAASVKDSAEDSKTTPSESELDPLPNPA